MSDMPLSAEAHAALFRDRYLKAKEPELFDTVDHAFARRAGPRYDQARAYNTAVYAALAASTNGQKIVYCAGSISKGMLANAWVKQEQPFVTRLEDGSTLRAHHVYDLDESIGSQNFVDKVLRPNRRLQLQKYNLLNTLLPDRQVLVPVALQGAVAAAGQPNLDLGSKRRDKDYMQVWTPVIRELTDTILVAGDWFFSGATSGLEYPEAIAIAAGLRRHRPQADMRFLDYNKQDVSLLTMSQRAAEYLLWAAESGDFYLKHEPTALMRNFAIARMAERGQLPKANPIFRAGIARDLPQIKALEKEMVPLILERVHKKLFAIDTTDLQATHPRFVADAAAAQAGVKPGGKLMLAGLPERLAQQGVTVRRYSDAELAAGDFELREIAAILPKDNYRALTAADAPRRVQRPADMAGEATKLYDGQSLFARPLVPLTTERERLIASVVVGALETVKPVAGQRYTYVVGDDKYGPETAKRADSWQLAYGDELPGKLGKEFVRDVRLPQQALIRAQQQALRAEGETVLSALDLQEQFKVVRQNPALAVAAGEAMPASAARMLARHAFLVRNATDFCFMTGQWEQSNDGVQDMILATRMQIGLQAGAAAAPQHVRVFDEKGRYLTLADRAEAIWKPLATALEKGRDPQGLEEPATALAQLWALHRLAADPALRQRSFEKLREQDPALQLPKDLAWDQISPFPFAYDHRRFEKLWDDTIKPAFADRLITAVRPRHLELIDDFAALRAQQEAKLALAAAAPLEHRAMRRRPGGAMPS